MLKFRSQNSLKNKFNNSLKAAVNLLRHYQSKKYNNDKMFETLSTLLTASNHIL
jgi:hypothetical protein